MKEKAKKLNIIIVKLVNQSVKTLQILSDDCSAEISVKELIEELQDFLTRYEIEDALLKLVLEGYDCHVSDVLISAVVSKTDEELKKEIEVIQKEQSRIRKQQEETRKEKRAKEYETYLKLAKKFKKDI